MTPWENNLNPITMYAVRDNKATNAQRRKWYQAKKKKVRKTHKLDVIYKICVQEFGDLSGEEKGREIFIRRTIYAKIAKELTPAYLREIGARMNRKHSAVINQLNHFETDVQGYMRFKYDCLLEKCKKAIETHN